MACVGVASVGPVALSALKISTPACESKCEDKAVSATPVENQQVYQILTQLGWNNPTDKLAKDSPAAILLSRHIHK